MQYRLQYVPSKKCYSVRSKPMKRGIRKKGKRYTFKNKIYAKCTTKSNATKQMRLLRAIKYNPNFVRRPRQTLRRSKRIAYLKTLLRKVV